MISRMKIVKSFGDVNLVNNITTVIKEGPNDDPPTEGDCLAKFVNFASSVSFDVSKYCNATYDSYLCWPPTKPNTVIQQHCPSNRFSDPTQYATRYCGEDGQWAAHWPNETSPKGWTNFTSCLPEDIQVLFLEGFNEENYQTKYNIALNSRYIEITGYCMSFFAIVISLIIFNSFRSLQNFRTLIHQHMFYAMLSQIIVYLIIFLDQFITRKILKTGQEWKGIDNTAILCEILYFIAENSISTVFSWSHIEGFHLSYLISNNALQPFNFKIYRIAGWAVPFFLTSIWAIITSVSYSNDKIKLCWFGYNLTVNYWILQGPRLAVIICNAAVLIRVLRMVIKKLRDTQTPDFIKIKKSAKAALVLIPLLSISNILTTFDISISSNAIIFMLWCYTRQFFKSFQGTLLSIIYCLGNEEVRSVVLRRFGNSVLVQYLSRFGFFRWMIPRQPVNEAINLRTIESNAPPNNEETTVTHVMRSTRLHCDDIIPESSFSPSRFADTVL